MCVFAREGFKGASMAKIIKESGMSAGAIYTYFETKEQLQIDVAVGIVDAKIGALDELSAAGDTSPGAVIRRFLEAMLKDMPDPGLVVQVWGEAAVEPDVRAMAGQVMGALTERLGRMVAEWLVAQRGVPEAEAHVRGQAVAPALLGLCQGFILRRGLLGDDAAGAYLDAVDALLDAL
ncbi:TetR/AcrR family transcriptional regulator [Falsarthrobacter nasiphocae]